MLDNPKLLRTLAAACAARAGDPAAMASAFPDPLDAALANACAVERGFLTPDHPRDLTPAGIAWAAGQLAPLRALIARVQPVAPVRVVAGADL